MNLILERDSYVNLNFSKQNEHFSIRIEHELNFSKKRKKELKLLISSILDLITNHERSR